MRPVAAPRRDPWDWLALVRVDDRLLHGQVALNWVKALSPTRIVIADDALAVDPLGRAATEAASPPGIIVWIGAVAHAAEALRSGVSPGARTIVLLRNPLAARALYDAGVAYPRLNLGVLGRAPERIRIGPQMSVSRSEWEALQYLEQAGVEVTLQALPTDAAVTLDRVRSPREWPRVQA